MIKHIILWKINDDKTEEEKKTIKENVKTGLEGLMGKIPGMLDIRVQIDSLDSSNADIMLDSSFEDVKALQAYGIHPEHIKVADDSVRPFMEVRMCMDYEK